METTNIKPIVFCVIAFFLLYSCQESDTIGPDKRDNTPPGIVKNVKVENLAGGAKLTYTLPDDNDLKEVRAEYTLQTGAKKEVKSSFYNNSLEITGYADSTAQQVKLYAVDKSENSSEPVTVTIHPKRSDIYDIFNSLKVQATFGGVQVDAQNPNRRDIAILVMQKNDLGNLEPLPNSIYTSTDSISQALRGLDTLRQDFAVTVRDQFQNYTDTLRTELKPLYETQLPDSKFNPYRLPGDDAAGSNVKISNMWDHFGNIASYKHSYTTYPEGGGYTGPTRVTFDLGQKARLSRFKIYDKPNYVSGDVVFYYNICMKHFEIWGTNDPPADGSFTNWTKLGTYTETKPSGLPYGEQSNEDYETANAGFNWEIPVDAPSVRYIRIVCLENWSGGTRLGIAELEVYGQPDTN